MSKQTKNIGVPIKSWIRGVEKMTLYDSGAFVHWNILGKERRIGGKKAEFTLDQANEFALASGYEEEKEYSHD